MLLCNANDLEEVVVTTGPESDMDLSSLGVTVHTGGVNSPSKNTNATEAGSHVGIVPRNVPQPSGTSNTINNINASLYNIYMPTLPM